MGRFLTTIFLLTPQVFLEFSDKIQFNEDDLNHHDPHQKPQEYDIFLEISGKIQFNKDDPNHNNQHSPTFLVIPNYL